jgi:hypothetical protein
MNTFFVKTSLKHDGIEYAAGEKITLDAESAQPLLDAGVIQTDSLDTPEPEVVQSEPEQTSADVAQVGGTETTSGEPAIDPETMNATADTAVDVSPPVETSPGADVQDDPSANL